MITYSNPTVTSNPRINSSSSNGPNHVPTLTLLSSLSEDENEEHGQEPVIQESITAIPKRERARAKIRELKKRKVRPSLLSGCKPGEEAPNGVFVRNDAEGRTAEVDMSLQTPQSCISVSLDDSPDQIGDDATDVDHASVVTLEDAVMKLPDLPGTYRPDATRREIVNRTSRTRKPSLKLQFQALTTLTEEPENEPASTPVPLQGLGKRSRDVAEIDDTVCKPKSEPLSMSEVNAEMDKCRSDTYKQAWSVSEQHLLERLLEEIPDGERNRHVLPRVVAHQLADINDRWAKISQAMGGRRTPRQVASRVQKYFEKLKRFGVGLDNKGKAKP